MLFLSLKGIINFTNLSSAIQRWCITHFICTQVASVLLNDLGLHKKEDIAREAHPSRIRKDIQQLEELMDFWTSCKNPFSEDNDSALFNIS